MNVTYRTLVINDYNEICSLWKNSGEIGFSESDSYEYLSFYLRRNDGLSIVVCTPDGVIVGTALNGHDGRRGFINYLYVKKEFRSLGIGRELALRSLTLLSNEKVSKVYIFVKKNNEAAISFWNKLGYQIQDDFLVMRRQALPDNDNYKQYEELNAESVIDYLRKKTNLLEDITEVEATEFGDGNMNLIFRVTTPRSSFIVKQSMPHGKINRTVYEPPERALFENCFIEIQSAFVSEYIVSSYYFDPILFVHVLEDLSDWDNLRSALMNQDVDIRIGDPIGVFLAKTGFYTSTFYLEGKEKRKQADRFQNYRLCQISEEFVLTDPFYNASSNKFAPELLPRLQNLWANKALLERVHYLRSKFCNQQECLLSGDCHTGNMFVKAGKIKAFDFEFAFYGPFAYDVGTIIGNLLLSYLTVDMHKNAIEDTKEYKHSILQVILNIWKTYHAISLHLLLSKECKVHMTEGYFREHLENVRKDTLMYAVCTLFGRAYGYAQFSEITAIADYDKRVAVQKRIIDFGEHFLLEEFDSIEHFITAIKSSY